MEWGKESRHAAESRRSSEAAVAAPAGDTGGLGWNGGSCGEESEADELIWRLEVEAETASTKAISRFLLPQRGVKSRVLRWG